MPPYAHLDPGAFHLAGAAGAAGDVAALLIHGFSGTPTEVRGLGEHLAAAGVTVSAPLLPGHGLHHRDLEKSTRAQWLDAAREALVGLRRSHRRVVIVGQSMGGLLALSLAAAADAAGDGVCAVVGLAPALAINRVAWLTRLPLPVRYINKHEEKHPDLVDVDRVRDVWSNSHTPVRVVPQLLRLGAETNALLPRLRAPLLVLQGLQDKTVRAVSAHRVMARAGSASKELVWLPRTGHIVAIDAERHEVWARILDFIRRTTA